MRTYYVATLGVRGAIFAARNKDQTTFKVGLIPLIAAGLHLDWRDMLRACAIAEVCATRVQCDFQEALRSAVESIKDTEFLTTIDGYFSRSDEMRSIDVMEILQIGDGPDLNFKSTRM